MAQNNAKVDAAKPLADQATFLWLCQQIETAANKPAKDRKNVIKDIIQNWVRDDAAREIYPMMRLLFPEMDRERVTYGMKEKNIVKYYKTALQLPENSDSANKLNNWRNASIAKHAGDIAAVVYDVMKERLTVKGAGLTIRQVNELLDQLVKSDKTKEDHDQIMFKFVKDMSALENKWLIRIILKNLKINLNEATLLHYHPDAVRLYNSCTDLEKVCKQLKDPNYRLPSEQQVKLFESFRPMLAGRSNVADAYENMGNMPFEIELKLDGERMQLHKSGDKYAYFSRNKKDYTYLYGGSPFEGSLTQHIHNVCFPNVKNIILDGEMVTIDKDGNFGRFGNLKTAALAGAQRRYGYKNDNDDDDQHQTNEQVCFVVFDILYINDESILDLPLNKRRQLLWKYVVSDKPYLDIINVIPANSMNELYDQINEVIETRQEGLVIKRSDSRYVPNARDAKMWMKVKPEYLDNLGDDVDVLVIGGFYSDGRRRGGQVSHFLCGVLDEKASTPFSVSDESEASAASMPSLPPSTSQRRFLTFCKFGSGLSDGTLHEVTLRLSPHWKDFNPARIPKWFVFPSSAEKPDLIIDPEKSIVVKIKASEIVPSTAYACGYTLRFPRLLSIRTDKTASDCMRIEEMHQLRRMAEGRLISKRAHHDYTDKDAKKKKTSDKAQRRGRATIARHLQGANLSSLDKTGDVFNNIELCIFHLKDDRHGEMKRKLEMNVVQEGGTIVQSALASTYCVVADNKDAIQVRNLVNSGKFNVVKSTWLRECLQQRKLLPFTPAHIIAAKPLIGRTFARRVDQYGDNYTSDITPLDLIGLCSKLREKRPYNHDEGHAALFSLTKRYKLFQSNDMGLFSGFSVIALVQSLEQVDAEQLFRNTLSRARMNVALVKMDRRAAVSYHEVYELPENVEEAATLLRAQVGRSPAVPVSHVLVEQHAPDTTREWAFKVASSVFSKSNRIKIIDPSWVESSIDAGVV